MKKILFILMLLPFFSCNDWLDVTPQAQVNADKLFSTPEGYESAVYGIYTAMTDASIYGTHMTFGFMDVLAQYYGIYNNNNDLMNVPNIITTMVQPKI